MRIGSVLLFYLILCGWPVVANADYAYLWCDNADEISAEVGASTGDVTLHHDAALYNCCPEPPVFTIDIDDRVVHVHEQVDVAMPCDCDCCFSLEVTVTDLAPGPWTVIYGWQDTETGGPLERELAVEVPATSAGGQPTLTAGASSDCLHTSAVPLDPELVLPWGALKGRYR